MPPRSQRGAPRVFALAALSLLTALPALAQSPLRSVVVPAEGVVVIPPRSAPRLAAAPAGSGVGVPIPPLRSGSPVLLPDTGLGLAGPVVGFVLPAIAGALLGGGLAGSRGGSSAPARTR